jgi:hypothetical protein
LVARIEQNRRRSLGYVEDFAIEERPKQAKSRMLAQRFYLRTSPESPGDSTMELRKYSRFFPQCEIVVALVSDEGNVLTGSLVDLSRSGLAFNYMSRFKCRIPRYAFCGVMLKNGREPLSDPIACEVIHEAPAWEGSCSAASMERCGIRFKRILSVSAMESLLAV